MSRPLKPGDRVYYAHVPDGCRHLVHDTHDRGSVVDDVVLQNGKPALTVFWDKTGESGLLLDCNIVTTRGRMTDLGGSFVRRLKKEDLGDSARKIKVRTTQGR